MPKKRDNLSDDGSSQGSDIGSIDSFSKDSVFEASESTRTEGTSDVNAELFKKQTSFEEVFFGILQALSNQKLSTMRYSVAHFVLEWIQLIGFVTLPTLASDGYLSKFISSYIVQVQLQYLLTSEANYFSFEFVFTTIISIILLTIAVFVGIQRDFKRNQVTTGWFATWFIRRCIMPMYGTFYVSTLGMLLLALDCNYIDGNAVNNYFTPPVTCWAMPHVLISITAIVFVIVFVVISFGGVLVKFELNFKSKIPLASRICDMHMRAFFLKTCLCFSIVFLKFAPPFYMAVFIFYIVCKLTIDVITLRAYVHSLFNALNSALYGMLLWGSFVQLIAVIMSSNSSSINILTYVLLGGLIPALGLGLVFHILQEKKYSYTRWIEEDAVEEGVAYVMDENEVDLVVMDCLRASAHDEQWMEKCEAFFASALQFYNNSSKIHRTYGLFLEIIKKDTSGGKFHLDQALRLSPSLQERFALFLNEQELKKMHSVAAGDSSMDLVSYIEFQGHYNNALKSHRRLLVSIRQFWKIICRTDTPSIEKLSRVFEDIDKLEENTTRVYRGLLRKYPKSVPLLRGYAAFLTGVQNETRKARKYFLEADRLEEAAEQVKKESSFGESSMSSGSAVDDKTDAIVVITEMGIIVSANKNSKKMFGYHENEMVGHNVSMLMPAPYKQQHNGYLQRYKQTHKAYVIGQVRRLEGEHKKGFTFSIELRVSRVESPMGTTYVGIIHKLQEDEKCGIVSSNSTGRIISANKTLLDMFGYSNDELIGKNVKFLMPPSTAENHDAYMTRTKSPDSEKIALKNLDTRRLEAMHKNGVEFPISISLSSENIAGKDIVTARITKLSDEIGVITINDKGKIKSVNDVLLKIFGYNKKAMVGQNINMLMGEPYSTYHHSYLKRYHTSGIPRFLNNETGRYINAKHSDGTLFPIHLAIMEILDSKGKKNFAGKIKSVKTDENSDVNTLKASADSVGTILTVNSAWKLIGYEEKDLVGQNIKVVLAPELALVHDKYISDYMKSRKSNFVNQGSRNTFLKNKEGVLLPCTALLEEEEIGRSTKFFVTARILDSLEAILEINEVGTIISSNVDATCLFGYMQSEMNGKNVKILMPEEIATNHDGYLENYAATKVRNVIGNRRLVPGKHKDGSKLNLFIEVAEFLGKNDRPMFIGRIQSVTEKNSKFIVEDINREMKKSSHHHAEVEENGVEKKKIQFRTEKNESLRFLQSTKTEEIASKSESLKKKGVNDNTDNEKDNNDVANPTSPSDTNQSRDGFESKSVNLDIVSKEEVVEEEVEVDKQNNRIAGRQIQKLHRNYGLKAASKCLNITRDVLLYSIFTVVLITFIITTCIGTENSALMNRMATFGDRSDNTVMLAIEARKLQLAILASDTSAITTHQANINNYASTIETMHRALFLGSDGVSPISFAPLLLYYTYPSVTYLEYADNTTSQIQLGLWEAGRKFVSAGWVLAFTPAETDITKDVNWRFIMDNIDQLIMAFSHSQELELENMLAKVEMYTYIEMCNAIVCLLVPFFLLMFALRPAFKRVYDERVFMFMLFTSLPKRVAHGLSKIDVLVNDGNSSVGDDNSSVGDDQSSIGQNSEDDKSSVGDNDDKNSVNSKGSDNTNENENAGNNKNKGGNKKMTKQERARKINKRLQDAMGFRSIQTSHNNNRHEAFSDTTFGSDLDILKNQNILPPKAVLFTMFLFLITLAAYVSNYYLTLLCNLASNDASLATTRTNYAKQMYFVANEIMYANSNSTYLAYRQEQMLTLVDAIEAVHASILHGKGILSYTSNVGCLYRSNNQDSLLFGTGCLRTASPCSSDPLFSVITSNGLDATLLFYIEQCRALAYAQGVGLNPDLSLSWQFISNHGLSDIYDGLDASANYFQTESQYYANINSGVASMKFVFFFFAFVFLNKSVFYPILRKINMESKRSAAMIAFLPADINVKELQQEQMKKKLMLEKQQIKQKMSVMPIMPVIQFDSILNKKKKYM